MASFSKIARAAVPTQTYTVFSMLSSLYKLLELRFYSKGPPCAIDYDSRKFSHELPTSKAEPDFEILKDMPSGVFRNTTGEILGLGAGKDKNYRNPEYFSYHHMTFYDVNFYLKQYRSPSPVTGRKPN
ncbi:hypothetical protein PYW08_007080 [Mythimna loreyi]|uniref:Uncharacterized protein n=1 Tax=Mythimna loreyi TaxID=667449 RepID=A0ACC2R8N1_9NEOP|nr:hypothetical protein PYW08_007080 [Mythimna loreyi]